VRLRESQQSNQKRKKEMKKKATAPDVVTRQEGAVVSTPIEEGARESVRTVGGQ
jgi:hypothetical protein